MFNMSRFAFILGHVPVLSSIEAKILIPDLEVEGVIGNVLIGSCSLSDPRGVMDRMGGMVKIARFEKCVSLDRLEEESSSLLASRVPEGKITFGVSWFGGLECSDRFAMRVKQQLKELGRSVRHVRGKEAVLNGAELAFNEFGKPGRVELCLIPQLSSRATEGSVAISSGTQNEIASQRPHNDKNVSVDIFVTEAFQDVGSFVELEDVLGARDDRSGVLPLRLAKMLVNISGTSPSDTLLDPFCGSGILVSVAATLGFQTIIASDSTPKAVADTKLNLTNVDEILKTSASWKVAQQDVRTLSRVTPANSVDSIITEPYLGPQTRVANDAELGQMKTLYHEAFKEFRKIVRSGGVVLFIFPVINSVNDFDEVQKSIRGMGFQKIDLMDGIREWFPDETEPVYSRPRQRVKRLITLWKKV